MKKFKSSMLGVTLLEIMLVLAIAAMIIVMSIRYYQSAGASSQANTIMQQLQAITALADNIAQTSGSYSQVKNDTLSPLLPTNGLVAPWGGTITVTPKDTTSYDVKVASPPASVCSLVLPKLKTNPQYGSPACSSAGLSYTYNFNPGT